MQTLPNNKIAVIGWKLGENGEQGRDGGLFSIRKIHRLHYEQNAFLVIKLGMPILWKLQYITTTILIVIKIIYYTT